MPKVKHNSAGADKGSQVNAFRDLARELECDEDEAAFERQVKKIVDAPRSEVVKDVDGQA